MPMALYCTAEKTLSLDLARNRAHMRQLHVAASPGTALPGVRVHGSTKLQAAHESRSLAGSLKKLISPLSGSDPGLHLISRMLPHA